MERKQQITRLAKKAAPSQKEVALCDTFRVLGDWNRYRMMKVLLEAKELCVGDLSEITGISMSATSQHLRILEMSGMVESKRMGQMICYKPRLDNPKTKVISSLLK